MTFHERKALRIAANRIARTLTMSPGDVLDRLMSGDTEAAILYDHDACIALGLSPSLVPPWRYAERNCRFHPPRDEDIAALKAAPLLPNRRRFVPEDKSGRRWRTRWCRWGRRALDLLRRWP